MRFEKAAQAINDETGGNTEKEKTRLDFLAILCVSQGWTPRYGHVRASDYV